MDFENHYAQAALANIYEFELYLEFTTKNITTRYITFVLIQQFIWSYMCFKSGRMQFWVSEERCKQIYDAETAELLKDHLVHMDF
jgi:hypothetical protein